MRAILIDPKAKTIEEIETSGSLEEIYRFAGCDCITTVRLGPGEVMYLDDEGLMRPDQTFFMLAGYDQPLAGRGLILGCTESGENAPAALPLGFIKRIVSWARPDLKWEGNDVSAEDLPGVAITRITPRFNR